jgi:hypothetical protein
MELDITQPPCLFLNLICQALHQIPKQKATMIAPDNTGQGRATGSSSNSTRTVVLKVYAVSEGQFPNDPHDNEDYRGVLF